MKARGKEFPFLNSVDKERFACVHLSWKVAEILRFSSEQETRNIYSSIILKYFIFQSSVGENKFRCATT
jgi:hypothetical protein